MYLCHNFFSIPLRFRLDPGGNFEYCLRRVAKLYQKSMLHGHLPYQCILKELQLPSTTSLNVFYDFRTNCSDEHTTNLVKFHNAQLEQVTHIFTQNSLYDNSQIFSKFDLSLIINHDQHTNTLTYTFNSSCDLFNYNTVQDLSQRFHILCRQLFSSSSFDLQKQPIYQLSIILPNEQHNHPAA